MQPDQSTRYASGVPLMPDVMRFSHEMSELPIEDLAFPEFLSEYLFPRLSSLGFKRMGNLVDGSAAGREILIKGEKEVLIEYSVHHLDHPGTFVKVEIRNKNSFLFFKTKRILFRFESEYLGETNVEKRLYAKINDYLAKHEAKTI